jgi:imidazolonepropionase-like amidohydrolase
MENDWLALAGGTIHPSPDAEPIPRGVILIRGGKIAAAGTRAAVHVPASARVLDCSGSTILAGFWNSHVHFFERKWAAADSLPSAELGRELSATFSRYGFTSVFDLGSPGENTRKIGHRVESGEVSGPRIRSTGEGLVPPGAVPSDDVLRVMGVMAFPAPEVATPEQARSASRKLLDQGADGIKVFASAPRGAPLSGSVMGAAVKEAHAAGKPVFVHPNSGADVLAALEAGVDVIAHTTPHSGAWDATVLAAIRKSRAALIPTLTLWNRYLRHDRVTTRERTAATALGQLRAWRDSGGTVLFGTDLGAIDPDPGEEYASMAAAGLGFREILSSLTTAPAGLFGESDSPGRVAEGMEADLAVIEGDPSADIAALASVRYTLRSGKIVYCSAPPAPSA